MSVRVRKKFKGKNAADGNRLRDEYIRQQYEAGVLSEEEYQLLSSSPTLSALGKHMKEILELLLKLGILEVL